jgi:DNA polymerase-3 subunit gamma/tau
MPAAAPKPAPPVAMSSTPTPLPPTLTATPVAASVLDADGWLELVASANLSGPAKQLAAHAAFLGHDGGVLRLALSPADEMLKREASIHALAQALAPALGGIPQVRFEAIANAAGETLHQRSTRERDARQDAAESAFLADPGVRQLMQKHGATLVPESIRPHDE